MTASVITSVGWMPAPRHRAALGAMMAVAVLARLLALDKSLYVDEIVTITVAMQPLAGMARVMRLIDASPALYPLLLHLWLQLGHADAWVRALSAVFGIAAVFFAYLIGRRVFGERAGLAAALVAAIAPAHVHYAQYVRSYSLFTLLAAVQLLLFIGWFERPTRWRLVALGVVTAAALYTHYLALLILLPEGAYLATRLRDARARAGGWVAGMCLAGVLFLPGVPLLVYTIPIDRARNEQRPGPPSPVRLLPDLMGELSIGQRALGFDDPTTRRLVLAGAAVIFPGLLVAGTVAGWRRNRDKTVLLLLFAFVPVLVYVLSGRRLVAVRFFVPFMTAYIVLLGNGLAAIGGRARALAAIALIVVCGVPLFHFYTRYQWSYDHRAVAGAINARLAPGDALLVVHPFEAFYYRWYLGPDVAIKGLVFTALEDQAHYEVKPESVRLETAVPRIEDAAGRYRRLWVIGQSPRSFVSDEGEQRRLLEWMNHSYRCVEDLGATIGPDPVVRAYVTQ